MQNQEKAINLLSFIKEFKQSNKEAIYDIDKQLWRCYIKDILIDSKYINFIGEDFSNINYEENDEVILAIRKPENELSEMPPPLPEELLEWIEDSWHNYKEEVKIIQSIERIIDNQTIQEDFYSDNSRIETYEKWRFLHDEWKMRLIEANKVRDFYNELDLYMTMIKNQPESYEIMIANGMLRENRQGSIAKHPLLIKHVKFFHDVKNNIIKILDSDEETTLYIDVIDAIDKEFISVKFSELDTFTKHLQKVDCNPFNYEENSKFLKNFIQAICVDGRYLNNDEKPSERDKLLITNEPVFIVRNKVSGFSKLVENIIQDITKNGLEESPLMELIKLDGKISENNNDYEKDDFAKKIAAANGEDIDILLSKSANSEQIEIARRIDKNKAVLVQGPPGTGKTHTIANLLGNFLAQGKRVLVTSKTRKALSVVKDKVEEELQTLCVSMLEESHKDMEYTVNGICEIEANANLSFLKNEENKLSKFREDYFNKLSETRKKIQDVRYKQTESIALFGERLSPIEAAEYVNNNKDFLNFIPGEVKVNAPLPLSYEEFKILYQTNSKLTMDIEKECLKKLPDINALMLPEDFTKFVNEQSKINEELDDIKNTLDKLNIKVTFDCDKKEIFFDNKLLIDSLQDSTMLNSLLNYTEKFNNEKMEEWLYKVLLDGKNGGGYKVVWQKLLELIETTVQEVSESYSLLHGKNIIVEVEGFSDEQIQQHIIEIKNKLSKGKKILGFASNFTEKPIHKIYKAISINGQKLNCANDCDVVSKYINIKILRSKLLFDWENLVTKNGGPDMSAYKDLERNCNIYKNKIHMYLHWYQNEHLQMQEELVRAGFNKEVFWFNVNALEEMQVLKEEINNTCNILPTTIILTRKVFLELKDYKVLYEQAINSVATSQNNSSFLFDLLQKALLEKNCDAYTKNYTLVDYYLKQQGLIRSNNLLIDKVKEIAPQWATDIKNKVGIHGQEYFPKEIHDIWKCKQLEIILENLKLVSLEKLNLEAEDLSKRLRENTKQLIKVKTQKTLKEAFDADKSKSIALRTWASLVKKIGKGTGKKAPRLKQEAKKQMLKCQDAVPVWIVAVDKVFDNFELSNNKFDVIIVDEASQLDISSLVLAHLCKKIIIVGDDQQVSPSNIGYKDEIIKNLQEKYLISFGPAAATFDEKSSLYSIAKQTFPVLMLQEHFRCVPDIIGYSNRLSYNFKVKPLRNAYGSNLHPATIVYNANGCKAEKKKTNHIEAQTIVALIKACLEKSEYKDKTFGVISMLGNGGQSEEIYKIMRDKINSQIIEKHKIVVGEAPEFQGDERDVIFLSLVDSNDKEGPMRKFGDGVDDAAKKRYNVAVSRAKDQIWVVHSFDMAKDLKNDDIRRDLIEYMQNPKDFVDKSNLAEELSESPFEALVAKELIAKGYDIEQQTKAGGYRIDITVQKDNEKIAIECDGARYHSDKEAIVSDMERQAILERVGWKFIRILGTDYYRDPEKTMNEVFGKLKKLGISTKIVQNTKAEEDLFINGIKNRAELILNEWKENDKENLLSNIKEDRSQVNDAFFKIKKVDRIIKNEKKNDLLENVGEEEYDTVSLLRKSGFECIDNRKESNIIWVISGVESENKIKNVINKECSIVYEKRGVNATFNKPAWRIIEK